MLRAGFAEIEITPPVGTEIVGSIRRIESRRVLDPLFARAAVFESDTARLGFVQIDVCFVSAALVAAMRARIEARSGFPGASVMVAATHNHAGPVTETQGECTADAAYVEGLVERVAQAFAAAAAGAVPAEVGQLSAFCFGVAHNRRVVMRDGTVRTHGTFADAGALCYEGPIDPEVAVLAARDATGRPLGVLVNFACHPTHHGTDASLSAGFPGVFADEMKTHGWPVPMFLNGAAGNMHTADPGAGGANLTKEEAGRRLAGAALDVLQRLAYQRTLDLTVRVTRLPVPFRTPTAAERAGSVRGAQRFVDPTIYDRQMAALVEWTTAQGSAAVELQVLRVGDRAYVGVPGEYFAELGLRVKEGCHPLHALVVGYANGALGYIPHREAFARGGYETTFGWGSKLAPGAGEAIAERAVALVREGGGNAAP